MSGTTQIFSRHNPNTFSSNLWGRTYNFELKMSFPTPATLLYQMSGHIWNT